MSSQVTVYSPMGFPLADLDVGVFRAFALNGYAEANFTISTRDNKCREEYLRFGNRILVQHSTLPDWVGIMDTPRTWGNKRVECHALGAEVWFDWRVTHIEAKHDSLANIFRYIIDDCNSWGGSQMNYGDIYNGGIDAVAALGGKASDHINRLTEKWHVDWSVTHRVTPNNRLALYANLYRGLRGSETKLVLNNTNSKLIDTLLTEDGAIYNHVFYYSEPGEGGARKVGDAKDDVSAAAYDLRQIAEQGVGSYEPGLDFAAYMRLQDTKEPDMIIPITALNVGDTFSNLRLGNVVFWDSDFVGFDGSPIGMSATLRIAGIEIDENDTSAGLVAQLLKRFYTRKELINLAREYTGQ